MMFSNTILFSVLIISIISYTTTLRVFVNYTYPYGIHCQVDELKETIKWMYNGTNVFLCPSPYRAGECNIENINITAFIVDVNSKTASLQLSKANIDEYKNTNAAWKCSHGDEEIEYTFNNIESPQIECFETSPVNVTKVISLNCTVNSTEPYKVTWSSFRRGIIESKENQISNIALINVVTKCTDNIDSFLCTVDNGVSFPTSETINIIVKCPTKVLYEEMNTTVNVKLGSDAVLSVLYSGNQMPNTIMWYRKETQNGVTSDELLTPYRTKETSSPDTHSMNLIIYSVQKQDEGDYSVEIYFNRTRKRVDYVLNVVSETVIPFNGYIGIGIGAGGTLFLAILTLLVACGIHRIKHKDDDYLSPIPPSLPPSQAPETPETPQPPQPPPPHTLQDSTSNPESTFSEPYSLYDEYVNEDSFRRNY